MKVLAAFVMAMLIIAGCSDSVTDDDTTIGGFRVEAFDSPPPGEVESINLHVNEVSVHSPESGWITVGQPDTVFDFLQLINGVTAVLVDTSLPAGQYTQLRLILADSNEVVIDGESYPLTVPSGSESGVKINLNFEIVEGEIIEIYVDFDASKSITWNPQKYILHPSFKAFKKITAATLSGSVADTLEVAIPNALIEASSSEYSSSTVTDSAGLYKLILPQGVYDVAASADGYTVSDTAYTDVAIDLEIATDYTGYDFILW